MRGYAWVWTVWLALGCSVAGCGERERPAVKVARPARPALRLVALTDLSGYLEPCGCQSRPLGGIGHAAAQINALRADKVPLLFVAAGDLLFGEQPEGANSVDQAATQETWKAESLVEILNRLGLTAATPGVRDLSYGPQVLHKLETLAKFAWLPPGPGDSATPERSVGWLGHVGPVKVGLLGISTFATPANDMPNERLRALQNQAQTELDRLRQQGAQVVIALISSDQRSGRRLASNLRGLHFAIQGGVDDANAPAPSRAGEAVLLRAGRQGQGLLVVDLYLDGNAVFADVSDWTRGERRAALNTQIDDLAQRVAAWQRDGTVDQAGLREQRDKLEQLRAQLAHGESNAMPKGNAFDAKYAPLGPESALDRPITALVDAYAARVNEHNRAVFADVLPPPAAPGQAAYVGSAACQTCHAPAFAWWTQHPHGKAYATLEAVHKQFNLSCVGCHVTGYGKPGGAAVVRNEGRTNVGCESCHGPGSKHVAQPRASTSELITRSPAESTCKQCHTKDHSDLFEFASYAARLRVAGHGLPQAKP
jgi:hypothetical protein